MLSYFENTHSILQNNPLKKSQNKNDLSQIKFYIHSSFQSLYNFFYLNTFLKHFCNMCQNFMYIFLSQYQHFTSKSFYLSFYKLYFLKNKVANQKYLVLSNRIIIVIRFHYKLSYYASFFYLDQLRNNTNINRMLGIFNRNKP